MLRVEKGSFWQSWKWPQAKDFKFRVATFVPYR